MSPPWLCPINAKAEAALAFIVFSKPVACWLRALDQLEVGISTVPSLKSCCSMGYRYCQVQPSLAMPCWMTRFPVPRLMFVVFGQLVLELAVCVRAVLVDVVLGGVWAVCTVFV